MLELQILIGLVIVLIIVVCYYIYKSKNSSSSFGNKRNEEMSFEEIEKKMAWERNPYEPEVKQEAKEGKLFDGDRYTGSASKYFANANEYPTLGSNDIEIAEGEQYEHNVVNDLVEYNPDDEASKILEDSEQGSTYDHQRMMEDTSIDAKARRQHYKWATDQVQYSGVAKSPDDVLSTVDYISWQGLRRPLPIKMHGIMPFVTEVDNEGMVNAGNKPFNFQ